MTTATKIIIKLHMSAPTTAEVLEEIDNIMGEVLKDSSVGYSFTGDIFTIETDTDNLIARDLHDESLEAICATVSEMNLFTSVCTAMIHSDKHTVLCSDVDPGTMVLLKDLNFVNEYMVKQASNDNHLLITIF